MVNANPQTEVSVQDVARAAVENDGPPVHQAPTLRGAGKKIWIDIDNSPHVPFFLPIIEELKNEGFEVDLTARDIYQVRELLDFFHLPCKVIGRHYGKAKSLKVLGTFVRVAQLIPTVVAMRPNLGLSHGSRAQILTCKSLGIPTAMMHDYEHSTKTGFLKPDWTLSPDIIPSQAMGGKLGGQLQYPGLKEDVYAHRLQPDASLLRLLGIEPGALVITLRPPATEAHYHNPESEVLFAATLKMLQQRPDVRAVTLPRNDRQKKQLQSDWPDMIASGQMIIPKAPLDGMNLIWFSDLVISGGGTMNREAAALGVPVYSIFRGKLGAVDRYLADCGRMILIERPEDVVTKIALTRSKRPATPGNSVRPALRSIVENLIQIVEAQCPTRRLTA